MAAKRKSKASKSSAPKPAGKPDPLTDLNAQEDEQVTIGGWAEAVSGEHKGLYGVVIDDAEGENVILRTRDANSERVLVDYSDLRPAESGRR